MLSKWLHCGGAAPAPVPSTPPSETVAAAAAATTTTTTPTTPSGFCGSVVASVSGTAEPEVFAVLNTLEPPVRLHMTKPSTLQLVDEMVTPTLATLMCYFTIAPLPEFIVVYWPEPFNATSVHVLVAVERNSPFRTLIKAAGDRQAEVVRPQWTSDEIAYAQTNPYRMGRLVVAFDLAATLTLPSLISPPNSDPDSPRPIRVSSGALSPPSSTRLHKRSISAEDPSSSPLEISTSVVPKKNRRVSFALPEDHNDSGSDSVKDDNAAHGSQCVLARFRNPVPVIAAPAQQSLVPGGRWGHAMIACDQQVWVFGGQGEKQDLLDERMWVCSPGLSTWMAVETTGTGPGKRMGHTAVRTHDGKIIVFGGSKYKRWFSDTLVLDLMSETWSTISTSGKVAALAYHSCTLYEENLLFVFGGIKDSECSDVLYCFDIEQTNWFKPHVTGERPCARSGHTATLVGKLLVIIGGWDAPVAFNDVYILDLITFLFFKPNIVGDAPSPRSWHSATLLPNGSIFVYGGFDGDNASNDAFLLSGVSNVLETQQLRWIKISDQLLTSARAGHTSSLVETAASAASVIIFGGGDNEGRFFNSTEVIPVSKLQAVQAE